MSGDFVVSNNRFEDSNVEIGRTITHIGPSEPNAASQTLLAELRSLRAELARRDGTASPAASAVAEAETAVASGDTQGTKAALRRAGEFALGCAKEIGTHLAESALEAALHLSG